MHGGRLEIDTARQRAAHRLTTGTAHTSPTLRRDRFDAHGIRRSTTKRFCNGRSGGNSNDGEAASIGEQHEGPMRGIDLGNTETASGGNDTQQTDNDQHGSKQNDSGKQVHGIP